MVILLSIYLYYHCIILKTNSEDTKTDMSGMLQQRQSNYLKKAFHQSCITSCLMKDTSKPKHMTGFFFWWTNPLPNIFKMNLINIRIFSPQLMLYLKPSYHSRTTHINCLHMGSDHLGRGTCINFIKNNMCSWTITLGRGLNPVTNI